MPSPDAILFETFGYRSFRPFQEAIVRDLCEGRDVLAIMPTGAGKSICFQVPAIYRPGCAVVVSPLIALMHDQVRALSANGVRAATLNSQSGDSAETIERLRDGALDLLYVSPERAAQPGFRALVTRIEVALIAIDEAHCVSQWGHDFRPEYRQLRALCDLLPGVPRIALTATADVATRADILAQLGIAPDRMVLAGFDRPNIRYEIAAKHEPRQQLRALLDRHRKQCGIIYAPTRSATETTADWLMGEGFNALAYHGGMEAGVRAANQERFVTADDMIMVATIAFGMGIDKPDVRFVAHLGLPKSIEAYYQETGRAGRDGEPATAHLLFGADDIARQRGFIDGNDATPERQAAELTRLNALVAFCETTQCRRVPLLTYFGEPAPPPCGNCDNCLAPPKLRDVTVAAQMLLSAVRRTGERFGVGHLVDVLHGKPTERVLKFGHDKLSVFGIGRALAKPQWEAVARALSSREALARGEYQSIVFGPRAGDYLKGTVPFEIRDEIAPVRRAGRTQTAPPTADTPLFEELRALRRELAAATGMPPYVIFHDATLRAMAAERPATLDALGRIGGVGARKLADYGPQFLRVIAASPPRGPAAAHRQHG